MLDPSSSSLRTAYRSRDEWYSVNTMASTSAPAVDNISTLPQPSHITLLLRHHKSATLISVSPTQSFDSIKDLLLSALKARNISSLPNASNPSNPTPLPASSNHLEFGVLIDRKDASKGWTLLTPDLAASASAKKKPATKPADVDTPAGLGLTDGSWLAYRVRSAGVEEDDEAKVNLDGDVVVDVNMADDPGWDVILPAFEDEEDMEEETADAGPS